jgi:hypothetical protein
MQNGLEKVVISPFWLFLNLVVVVVVVVVIIVGTAGMPFRVN